MDVSPKPARLASPRRSIPFLENDDANRALMGSNMQRQAVPVVRRPKSPLVGTGMEAGRRPRLRRFGHDRAPIGLGRGGGCLSDRHQDGHPRGERRGRTSDAEVGADIDIYNLTQVRPARTRTPASTSALLVKAGRYGSPLATSSPTDRPPTFGELALGPERASVAFMPWQGYNFEDSILHLGAAWSREDVLHHDPHRGV